MTRHLSNPCGLARARERLLGGHGSSGDLNAARTRVPRGAAFRPTALAMALMAALGATQTWAADTVDSTVTVGGGIIIGDRGDRLLADQYNGLRTGQDGAVLLGAEYYRRIDDTGTTFRFNASDLLGESRELSLRWKQRGDWKLLLDYAQTVRRDPFVVNTGLAGAGTTTPTVNPLSGGPGTGSDLDLKVKRTALGMAFSKVVAQGLQLDVSLKGERKEGARLFGIGMTCPSAVAPGCSGTTGITTGWALLMLPEPIDAHHSQVEARLSYGTDRFSLSGGYYGSFYRNDHGSLNPGVPDSLYNPLGTLFPLSTGLQSILSQPVALAPDNQAHQIDLGGTFKFDSRTRLNFKVSRAQATQNQDFTAAGLTGGPAGVTSLNGRVDTTRALLGVSSRPLPRLSLLGDVRWEERDDRTPLALYNVEGTETYTNRRLPYKKLRGRLLGNYQFTTDVRGSLGVDSEAIDRGVFTASSAVAGITALRQKTDETSVHAELRGRVTDVMTGSIAVVSSRRDGSNWLRDNSGLGVTEIPDPSVPGIGFDTGIFMPTLANRRRDKLRLNAEFQPSEGLSIQLSAEQGRDRLAAPGIYGVRRVGMNLATLDWDYAFNSRWSVNGYVSRGQQELDQARPSGVVLAYDNTSTSVGIGLSGKPSSQFEVGGTLALIDDLSTYAQSLTSTAAPTDAALLAATGGLPDIVFRQAQLKLFAKWTLDKRSAIRVDLVHQHAKWNDWAWSANGAPFVYSDGTTINSRASQTASFIGVSYIYHWAP